MGTWLGDAAVRCRKSWASSTFCAGWSLFFSLTLTSLARIVFCMAPNILTIHLSLSQRHGNSVEGAEGRLKGKLKHNNREIKEANGWAQQSEEKRGDGWSRRRWRGVLKGAKVGGAWKGENGEKEEERLRGSEEQKEDEDDRWAWTRRGDEDGTKEREKVKGRVKLFSCSAMRGETDITAHRREEDLGRERCGGGRKRGEGKGEWNTLFLLHFARRVRISANKRFDKALRVRREKGLKASAQCCSDTEHLPGWYI